MPPSERVTFVSSTGNCVTAGSNTPDKMSGEGSTDGMSRQESPKGTGTKDPPKDWVMDPQKDW